MIHILTLAVFICLFAFARSLILVKGYPNTYNSLFLKDNEYSMGSQWLVVDMVGCEREQVPHYKELLDTLTKFDGIRDPIYYTSSISSDEKLDPTRAMPYYDYIEIEEAIKRKCRPATSPSLERSLFLGSLAWGDQYVEGIEMVYEPKRFLVIIAKEIKEESAKILTYDNGSTLEIPSLKEIGNILLVYYWITQVSDYEY